MHQPVLAAEENEAVTVDSGFLVALMACNTLSALVFVNWASTSITSCAPSMMVELTQNWSSEDVTTLVENAWWSFANDGRAAINVTPNKNIPPVIDLSLVD